MTHSEVYALVRRAVDTPGAGTDPREIAGLVLKDLHNGDRLAVLRAALPLVVSRVLSQRARSEREATAEPTDGLQQRVCITPGNWKVLADCTEGDLTSMANFRRRVAAEHLEVAATYDRLAESVCAAGVETVSEVSVRVLSLVT